MAIRVLATFPELAAPPERVHALEPAAVEPAPSAVPARDAPAPTIAKPRRRGRSRASFPGSSIAALAVIAAAIWSLVALREARRPGGTANEPRIAAEAAQSAAPETTLR